ncbi:MAG: hypothetical protein ABFS38_21740 [Bacteroidota bacterium]
MKKLQISILLLALFTAGLFAQQKKSIDGIWLGTLKVQSMELRLAFTFTGSDEGNLEAVMTSIDQGRAEVPMDKAILKGDTLLVSHVAAGIKIRGVIDPAKKSWETEFTQGPVIAPLLFNKVESIPE